MSDGFKRSDIVDFFLLEAGELLQILQDGLLSLEKNSDDLSVVDEIFKSAHTIKGSAAMLGFEVVSKLAHNMEDLLGKIRKREIELSESVIDLLLQTVDTLTMLVESIPNGEPEDELILAMFSDLYAEFLEAPQEVSSPINREKRDPTAISAVAELAVGNCLIKVTLNTTVNLNVDAIAYSGKRSFEGREATKKISPHGTIQQRGGIEETDKEASRYAPLEHGAICVIHDGTLLADHVIHVGVIDDLEGLPVTENILKRAVNSILDECKKQKWNSVAIPLMGEREGDLLQEQCAEIMFEEVYKHLERGYVYPQFVIFSISAKRGLARMVALVTEYKTKHAMISNMGLIQPVQETESFKQSHNISPRLQYAIENKFPYPIARAFYQLRRIDDWLAEIPQLANILGLMLQHLAMLAVAEYLSGKIRDHNVNDQLITAFQKPLSHGNWAGVLRTMLTFLREQSHDMFLSELSEFYFPQKGERNVDTLKKMSDELIERRNDLLKRRTESLPPSREHRAFKQQLIEFLQTLAFLTNYPLVSVKNTQTKSGIKTHTCYLHTGFHDNFELVTLQCDLDLEKMRVMMLNPSKRHVLYLYPFYVVERAEEDSNFIHMLRFSTFNKNKSSIKYALVGGPHQEGKPVKKGEKGKKSKIQNEGIDFRTLLQGLPTIPLRQEAKYLYYESTDTWKKLSVGHFINRQYEIVEHLRRGGMADVYKVKDVHRGNLLALKLLPFQFLSNSTLMQRFRQEAMYARRLNHPNITRVFDYGEDLADHYLVMELATGWVTEEGRLALDVGELPKPVDKDLFLIILKQACEGLDFIHQQEIIHRDMKPGNLLLFEKRQVKITDFGVARSQEAITLTLTGLSIGTPEYMSPEQVEGKKNVTPASDIYSLGVVMYELLTGRSPFKRKTPLATALAHLHNSVLSLQKLNPSIDSKLQGIVMKCLKKSPEARFRTARELFEALRDYENTIVPPQIKGVEQETADETQAEPAAETRQQAPERERTKEERRKEKKREPSLKQQETPEQEKIKRKRKRREEFLFETATVNAQREIIREKRKARQYTEDLGTNIVLEMVYIPSNTFLMGSPATKEGSNEDEGPQHQVIISPFRIGKFPVTQEQRGAVMETNPSQFKGPKRAVEQVSWYEAIEFCKRLSEKTGHAYRLPSEAEWEYACRAGTRTPFYFGETITPTLVNYYIMKDISNPFQVLSVDDSSVVRRLITLILSAEGVMCNKFRYIRA